MAPLRLSCCRVRFCGFKDLRSRVVSRTASGWIASFLGRRPDKSHNATVATVKVASFYMDRYPCANEAFSVCGSAYLVDTKYSAGEDRGKEFSSGLGAYSRHSWDNKPVVWVTNDEARSLLRMGRQSAYRPPRLGVAVRCTERTAVESLPVGRRV